MSAEQPEVQVIAKVPGAYSLARLEWAAGRVLYEEVVCPGADPIALNAAMLVRLPGDLVSSCWTESCPLGGPGWVHTYAAA